MDIVFMSSVSHAPSEQPSRLLGVVASLLLLSVVATGCDAFGPWRKSVSKSLSPDGTHVAELLEEDSGGTGGVWTKIKVTQLASRANEIVYSIHGVADNTMVKWNGPNELLITDPKLATAEGPRHIESSFDGIRIRAVQPAQ